MLAGSEKVPKKDSDGPGKSWNNLGTFVSKSVVTL